MNASQQGHENNRGINYLNSRSSSEVYANPHIRDDHHNSISEVEEWIEAQVQQNRNKQNDPNFQEAIEIQNDLKKNRLEVRSWYFFKSNISLYERSDKLPSRYFTSIAEFEEKYFKGKKRSLGKVENEAEWTNNAKLSTDNFKMMVDYNTQWNRGHLNEQKGTKGKDPNQTEWEILFPKFFIGGDFDTYRFAYKNLQKKNKGYGSIKYKFTKGIKKIYSGIKKIGKLLFRTLEITVLITAVLTLLALAIALSIPWLVIKLISICMKLQEEPRRAHDQEEPVPQQIYQGPLQVEQVAQQVNHEPEQVYYGPQQVDQEPQQIGLQELLQGLQEEAEISGGSGLTSITGGLSESPSNSGFNSDNHFLSAESLESATEENGQHGSL